MFDIERGRWEVFPIDHSTLLVGGDFSGSIWEFRGGSISGPGWSLLFGRYRPVPDEPRRFHFEFPGDTPDAFDVLFLTDDRFVAIKKDMYGKWKLYRIGKLEP